MRTIHFSSWLLAALAATPTPGSAQSAGTVPASASASSGSTHASAPADGSPQFPDRRAPANGAGLPAPSLQLGAFRLGEGQASYQSSRSDQRVDVRVQYGRQRGTTTGVDIGQLVNEHIALGMPGDPPFKPLVISDSDGRRHFSSSNTAVATIDADTGEITVVGAGETTITLAVDATSSLPAVGTTAVLQVAKRSPDLKAFPTTYKPIAGEPISLALTTPSTGAITVAPQVPGQVIAEGSGASWTLIFKTVPSTALYVIVTQAEDANYLAKSISVPFTPTY